MLLAEVVHVRQEAFVGLFGIGEFVGAGGFAAEQASTEFETGHDGDGFGGTDAPVFRPISQGEVGKGDEVVAYRFEDAAG